MKSNAGAVIAASIAFMTLAATSKNALSVTASSCLSSPLAVVFLVSTLLVLSLGLCLSHLLGFMCTNNYWNKERFDKVIAKIKRYIFFCPTLYVHIECTVCMCCCTAASVPVYTHTAYSVAEQRGGCEAF